jgi:hypothetical protein
LVADRHVVSALQDAADDLFAPAITVAVGGVEPGDVGVERRADEVGG